ncbi:RF-1 domain-containing protein [Infundibulicybe gibba]|nr:RF-1 domain-containing protein [Infundibulicybe gibba]
MSISPVLRVAARSAYRDLWRASATTFSGDEPVLHAFRSKMRSDALHAQSVTDPEAYREHTKLAREVALVLRRNIVQGVKIRDAEKDKNEVWKLKFTQDTELGSNDTIKNPPLMESSRSARKRGSPTSSERAALHNSTSDHPPRNYSALKKAHKERKVPELREEDLEESFVRGSGPGGQSINKTENNVQLHHKPTGLRVSCQETRSLALNRYFARKWLLEKLDKVVNPGLSKGELARASNARENGDGEGKLKRKPLTGMPMTTLGRSRIELLATESRLLSIYVLCFSGVNVVYALCFRQNVQARRCHRSGVM